MKTIAKSVYFWIQPFVVLNIILLSRISTAGSVSLLEAQVPRVSIKVSTSVAQSSLPKALNEAVSRSRLGGGETTNHRDIRSSQESNQSRNENAYRQRSLNQNNGMQESADFSQQLSNLGKIWELPDYRQSVSSSFLARGPVSYHNSNPTPNESYQLSRVNNQVTRSVCSKAKDCDPQGRSLGKVLRRAKHLLFDGLTSLERFATSGSIMFGSSLLAAAIPLAVHLMPDARDTRQPNQLDETMLSRLGLQSRVDSLMGWIERSVNYLPHVPHLHPQECLKRSICEAHSEPKKYGAIGFALRQFFPATNVSITERMDNMDYKVINKYRHAAGFGQSRRMDSMNGTGDPTACKLKYDDCLVSLLDVARHLMDTFLQ